MSQFDKADRQGSAALDRALADPLTFTPTRPQQKNGDRVTIVRGRNTATYVPDPDREPRPRPGETTFRAVITWRSYFMGAGDEDGTKRDVLAANDVMLDFDRSLFATDAGERLPMTGDLFGVVAEDGHTIVVQQSREPFDDGGARIVVFCIAPTG